ncbi:MAG: phage tail tape measure protein [Vampirovibrionia bacterium]
MATFGTLLLGIDIDKQGSKRVTDSLAKIFNQTKSLNDATTKLARTLAGPLTQGFALVKNGAIELAKETYNIGSSFEQAIKTVGAISGETAENMTLLEQETRRLGATTSFTAMEAANAMTTLARSGMKAQELLSTTSNALLFAGAASTTLTKSASLLSATMKQFSMSTVQSANVTDTFTVALKESLFDMQSLTAAMRYGGSIGSSFNMTLEETVASLAMFRNLGLEGSMAGTQFRMAMSKASKETNRGTRALQKYNLSYKDINPSLNSFIQIMEKVGKANMSMTDIITVFGVRSAGSINKISRESIKLDNEYDRLMTSMRLGADITKQVYDEVQDTVERQLLVVKSAQEEVAITLFDSFKNPLKDLLKVVSGTFKKVSDSFRFLETSDSSAVFEKLGNVIEETTPAIIKIYTSFNLLLVDSVDTIAELIPTMVSFINVSFSGLRSILSITRIVNSAFTALSNVAYIVKDALDFLADVGSIIFFGKLNERVNDTTKGLDLLFTLIASALVGGALYKLNVMLGYLIARLVVIGSVSIFAKLVYGVGVIEQLTIALRTMFTTISAGTLVASGGLVKILALIISVTASFAFFSTNLSTVNSETSKAISLNERLRLSLEKIREEFSKGVTGNVTTPASINAIDSYIDKIKASSETLTEFQKNTIKSLEATKKLTTEQVEQGFKSGTLIKVTNDLGTAFLSVRDAMAISGSETEGFGTKMDATFDQVFKSTDKIITINKSLSSMANQLRELKAIKVRFEGEEDIDSLLNQMNLLGSNAEETSSNINSALSRVESSFHALRNEVTEVEIEQQGLLEKFDDTENVGPLLKSISSEMRTLAVNIATTKVNLDNATNVQKAFTDGLSSGMNEAGVVTQLATDGISTTAKTLGEAKQTVQEYIVTLGQFRKRYEGILANILTGEEELNKPKEDGKGKVDPRYKSMFEARLKLMEKVAKRERDIFALSSEVEKNKLQDRFKEIHKHFKKEMALYKKGSKQRINLARMERSLIAQEYSTSLNERMFSFTKYTSDVVKSSNKFLNNQLQNIEKERGDSVDALTAEQFANKNLAEIAKTSLDKKSKGHKKALLQMDSLVDSTKQLNIITELQSQANLAALDKTRKKLQTNRVETVGLTRAKEKVKKIDEKITTSIEDQAISQKELDKLLAKNPAKFRSEKDKKRIDALEVYIQTEKNLRAGSLKKQMDEAKLALKEQTRLDKELFSDRVHKEVQFVNIREMVHKHLRRQSNMLYKDVSKFSEEDLKKREMDVKTFTDLGIKEDQVFLLNKALTSSKRVVMQQDEANALRAIDDLYHKKKDILEQETLNKAIQARDELISKEKSLYDQLIQQQNNAVAEARKSSDELANRTGKIYDQVIPQVIRKALEEQLNLYGDSTEQILSYEEQLLESRNKNMSNLFNDTSKNIQNSTKEFLASLGSIDTSKILPNIGKSFTDFGKSVMEADYSWNNFVKNLKEGGVSAGEGFRSLASSSMDVLSFINPYKNANEEIIQLEINKEKELIKIRAERKNLETKFNKQQLILLKANNTITKEEAQGNISMLEALLERSKAKEEQIVRETETKKTSVIFASIKKTVDFAVSYAQTISGFYSKIFNGLSRIASIGVDTFSKLTGFSFDFGSALGDVVSKMDEVSEKEKEIQKGVVDGRFSPEQAAQGMAGVAQNPAQLASEFIDNLIEKSFTFMDTFAEAGPELIRRLGERLPELTAKLAETLPQAIRGFVEVLPILLDGIIETASSFITILVESLPELIDGLVNVLTDKLPDIINVLVEKLPQIATSLLNAIVQVLPILLTGLIKLLPTLIRVGINAVVQLIPLIIHAFIFELIPLLPMIAGELVIGIVKGVGVLLLSIVKAVADLFNINTDGLSDTINSLAGGSSSYEAPTGFYSGINYVPKKMLAELHQGEAVIPADVNARRMGSSQNPALAGSSALGARGAGNTAQPIDIAVMAEGRLLDSVQVLAMDRGHAPKLNKRFQRASGVTVGFSRGKFSKYN